MSYPYGKNYQEIIAGYNSYLNPIAVAFADANDLRAARALAQLVRVVAGNGLGYLKVSTIIEKKLEKAHLSLNKNIFMKRNSKHNSTHQEISSLIVFQKSIENSNLSAFLRNIRISIVDEHHCGSEVPI